MIELRITADNPTDLRDQLSAMLTGASAASVAQTSGAAAPAAETAEAPKSTRGRKAAEPKPVEPAAEGTTDTKSTPASSDGPTATSNADQAVTKADLEPLCHQYAAKAGPPALKEVFTENGSAAGNFSGVPVENYPAVKARLEELLA